MEAAVQRWRKSSFSGTATNCVEIRATTDATDLRDSKNREGGHLTIPTGAWSAFLKHATRQST